MSPSRKENDTSTLVNEQAAPLWIQRGPPYSRNLGKSIHNCPLSVLTPIDSRCSLPVDGRASEREAQRLPRRPCAWPRTSPRKVVARRASHCTSTAAAAAPAKPRPHPRGPSARLGAAWRGLRSAAAVRLPQPAGAFSPRRRRGAAPRAYLARSCAVAALTPGRQRRQWRRWWRRWRRCQYACGGAACAPAGHQSSKGPGTARQLGQRCLLLPTARACRGCGGAGQGAGARPGHAPSAADGAQALGGGGSRARCPKRRGHSPQQSQGWQQQCPGRRRGRKEERKVWRGRASRHGRHRQRRALPPVAAGLPDGCRPRPCCGARRRGGARGRGSGCGCARVPRSGSGAVAAQGVPRGEHPSC
jgi:hypothetical protein